MSMLRPGASIAALVALAGVCNAQVVINEVFENPPGGGSSNDAFLEYIELYGQPGMDLTGYAIGQLKGGEDANGDDVPEEPAEIDEAFSLDGLSLGSNGFLVLYNGTPAQSLIPLFLPMAGEASASFFDTHIPTTDTNGNLNNDGSSTYVLVRKRENHSVENGVSVYGPGYAFRKDVNHDVDYDGRIDFGFETPGFQAPLPSVVDPVQIIDSFAWSNAGGKEYVRISEYELSETKGFNPDAASRLAYFGTNPMLGLRMNSEGATVPTRIADEEFIYGDMIGASIDFTYDPSRSGAPTDPDGDGFQDIAITDGTENFVLTPGAFNDNGTLGITQFRFLAGDLDFNGAVDQDDLALLDATLLGADFDATEDFIDPDTGLPVSDPNNEGANLQSYVFQDRLANAFLSARNLVTDDGVGGANADTVTEADRAALVALVGEPVCVADFNEDGNVNVLDVLAFLTAWNGGLDFNGDGGTNILDVLSFIQIWNAGCP
jgi:hypothetical protein